MILVRLKSFTTYGFKSFADKIELSFDKGITAVVGPNGSGKSNISDAILWVLGEQSARYLRGSKMEDVIFSGSSRRRALGVAEVTVNFDNTDHVLPLDFDEVSLTRRLYRSGDSEYAINKKSCRLKDIVDLMADTGLGKGSMSIIGQNKIDEILNSRPEERRALFEEAAGIAKYRLRKKDAARRLDDTAANLTRIYDIKTEVENQVAPLAVAAEKTKQFNLLNEELRRCRLSVLMRKLDGMADAKEQLLNKQQDLQTAYAEKAAVLSSKQAEAANLQLELDALAESYSKLQDEIKNKETALEKMRGTQGILEERIQQNIKASERIDQRNSKISEQADELERKMQELAEEFDTVEKKRIAADLQVQKLTCEKNEQEKALEEAKHRNEAEQSKLFASMQELLKIRNELRSEEQAQEQRVKRRDALKKNIDDTEAVLSKLEEQYSNLLESQSRNQHDGETAGKLSVILNTELENLKNTIKSLTAQQQDCQRRLTAAETREQSLQKMQASYEGFGYGIKTIIKAQEQWHSGIIGVAAELINVDEKYITAIETALGEGAQNIVTRDAATAKEAIAYLKQHNAGRATFLPLDTVQKRTPTLEETKLDKLPGICGFAVDLIDCDEEAENAIRFLLGRVLIAENIDAALTAAKASKYRLRVVTLSGDVVNAGGSMTGGSRKQKEGLLSRQRDIQQMQAEIADLHKEMLSWQEQIEEQEELAAAAEKKLNDANSRLQQLRLKFSELKLRLEQLEQEKCRENEKLALLLDDRSIITNEYMANRDKIKSLRAKVQESEAQDSEAKQLLEGLQRQIAMQGSTLTSIDNQLQDARIQQETASGKSELISERMRNLDDDTLRLRDEAKNNLSEQERLSAIIEECRQEQEELNKNSILLMEDLKNILGGKDRYAEERSSLLAAHHGLEQELIELGKQTSQIENKLRQLELELTKQQSDYEHALSQLSDDYNLDEASARKVDLSDFADLDNKGLQKNESRLALSIADLGPVNPSAIEEYQAVKERSEFLAKQYADLCTAKDNLEAVIGDINSGMTKRFKDAFAKINVYFSDCYIKLFGGGTAILKLTDPENILESGIDIEVQPPGKKLQSLYLLSGGERALTVIALLFALLSYQPSPFCILDEIDAALDDANIVRFSKFLREYSADTQFIVITHRKGTMECADIMYGVTMEESGVSKLLSVKINAKE